MENTACAFTGHRPKSFPWKYNETAPECVLLKEVLATQIKMLAGSGVMVFLSGMAQGVDLWSSQIVLDLQKKKPALKLHCVLPCKEQESKWTASAQETYRSILAQANEVVYVGQEYSRDTVFRLHLVHIDLADVVQKSADSDAFVLLWSRQNPVGEFPHEQRPKTLVNVQAVFRQSTVSCEMEPGAGWGGEKIGSFQPLQQLIRAWTMYPAIIFVGIHKLQYLIHK